MDQPVPVPKPRTRFNIPSQKAVDVSAISEDVQSEGNCVQNLTPYTKPVRSSLYPVLSLDTALPLPDESRVNNSTNGQPADTKTTHSDNQEFAAHHYVNVPSKEISPNPPEKPPRRVPPRPPPPTRPTTGSAAPQELAPTLELNVSPRSTAQQPTCSASVSVTSKVSPTSLSSSVDHENSSDASSKNDDRYQKLTLDRVVPIPDSQYPCLADVDYDAENYANIQRSTISHTPSSSEPKSSAWSHEWVVLNPLYGRTSSSASSHSANDLLLPAATLTRSTRPPEVTSSAESGIASMSSMSSPVRTNALANNDVVIPTSSHLPPFREKPHLNERMEDGMRLSGGGIRVLSSHSTRLSIDNPYSPPPKRDMRAISGIASPFLPLLKDAFAAVPEGNAPLPPIDIVAGPSLEPDAATGRAVSFFGWVHLHIHGKKEKKAHGRLRNMHISFHEDDETDELLVGPFQLIGCQLIQWKTDSICIRLAESETQKHIVFSAENHEENHTWALLLSECWLTQYDDLSNAIGKGNATSCAHFWVKAGATSDWQRAAASFHEKSMYYVLPDSYDVTYELDIRKILAYVEKVHKRDWCNKVKKNCRGPIMLTLEGCSMYLEGDDDWITNKLFELITVVLHAKPETLSDYRLTADNVPIIVDKCIRFIAVFGMSSEGIYRRNGKMSESKDMLKKLMDDPAGTHLVPNSDESVYAVADVLRRFFRELDKPVFPKDVHAPLFAITNNIADCTQMSDETCAEAAAILTKMPIVNYSTLRKLMSHLRDVSNNSEKNKASVENLGKMFGQSLFHCAGDEDAGGFIDTSSEIRVVANLIWHYDRVFETTGQEDIRRQIVDQATQKVGSKVARADGLLVPIHVFEKENMPFNVKADLAAEEIIIQAMARRGFEPERGATYAIFEVVRGNSLRRQLQDWEKVSSVVVNRWLPWGCTDGYLLFAKTEPDDGLIGLNTFAGKVRIAEPGSKTFKSFEIKVEEGVKIVAYKEKGKHGDKPWKSWHVDETIWFPGAETGRKAPAELNVTVFLIEGTLFTEKLPGYCLTFKSRVEMQRFVAVVKFLQTGGRPAPLIHL